LDFTLDILLARKLKNIIFIAAAQKQFRDVKSIPQILEFLKADLYPTSLQQYAARVVNSVSSVDHFFV
jgi:hypothetical protein